MPKQNKNHTEAICAGTDPTAKSATKKNTKKNRKNSGTMDINVSEEFKIDIEKTILSLLSKADIDSYPLPGLSSDQRKFVHERCRYHKLKSKSHGVEPDRIVHILLTGKQNCQQFFLIENTKINNVINRSLDMPNEGTDVRRSNTYYPPVMHSKLNTEAPVIPPAAKNCDYEIFRKQLPIYGIKSAFLGLLHKNQVIIISSETGSGKSTQIPQYILEQATHCSQFCKIICTQPRRISTISVAERVAAERGEEIGHTIGYQIRLEGKSGKNSALIYCTNGVLLRTFMSNNGKLDNNITHVIIDEVHERDKSTDILLLTLREILKYNSTLKVILMSATINTNIFVEYFGSGNVKTLHAPGNNFKVDQIFLEGVLSIVNPQSIVKSTPVTRSVHVGDYDHEEMNRVIDSCIETKDNDDSLQLVQLILSENADINHQTPDRGYTPLMAAAISGNCELAETLLNMRADTKLTSASNHTALQWAALANSQEVYNYISDYETYAENPELHSKPEGTIVFDGQNSFMSVNFKVLIKLILAIHNNDSTGTILVFFPGYEDIVTCSQQLTLSDINQDKIMIICLHSGIQSNARQSVFKTYRNVQKIILSTNVAETGITIPDVKYVIDTGLAKETSYDSRNDICILQKVFISKSSVIQRRGRAGRTCNGVSFHLYSTQCYNSLLPSRDSEILRIPLYEICLQSKLLAPAGMSIAEFLSLAIECPPLPSITRAIAGLTALGALDEDEELTLLGQQLLQLSLEPRLGKMLIYSVFLKCIDPILTIVACLSHKDPFCLPSDFTQRKFANSKQVELTRHTLSDHYGLIKAFQIWQNSITKCTSDADDYFISKSVMALVNVTRTQLLSQLRAMNYVHTGNGPNSMFYLNKNSNNWALVKSAIVVGCYPNLAFMTNNTVSTRTHNKVRFNASSGLNGIFMPDCCVMYEELLRTGNQLVIRCGTIITPLTIALICGEVVRSSDDGNAIIDNWLEFDYFYENFLQFRKEIQTVFKKRIANPRYILNVYEQNIFSALAEILAEEDDSNNLLGAPDVGKPPKLIQAFPFIEGCNNIRNRGQRSVQSQHALNDDQSHLNYHRVQDAPVPRGPRSIHGPRHISYNATWYTPVPCRPTRSTNVEHHLNYNGAQNALAPNTPGYFACSSNDRTYSSDGHYDTHSAGSYRESSRPTTSSDFASLSNGTTFSNDAHYHTHNARDYDESSESYVSSLWFRTTSPKRNTYTDYEKSKFPSSGIASVEPATSYTSSVNNSYDLPGDNLSRTNNSSRMKLPTSGDFASLSNGNAFSNDAHYGTYRGRNVSPLQLQKTSPRCTTCTDYNMVKPPSSTTAYVEPVAETYDEFNTSLYQQEPQATNSYGLPGNGCVRTNNSSSMKLMGAIESSPPVASESFLRALMRMNIESNGESNPRRTNIFPNHSVFFVIILPDEYSFELALSSKNWKFSQHCEKKLCKFFQLNHSVILFFTIKNSKVYQGVAKLVGTNNEDRMLPCPIEWIHVSPVSFDRVDAAGLVNYSDRCMPLYDGQEVEFTAALELYEMFLNPEVEVCRKRPILAEEPKFGIE